YAPHLHRGIERPAAGDDPGRYDVGLPGRAFVPRLGRRGRNPAGSGGPPVAPLRAARLSHRGKLSAVIALLDRATPVASESLRRGGYRWPACAGHDNSY